eukprot:s2135_g21.t1
MRRQMSRNGPLFGILPPSYGRPVGRSQQGAHNFPSWRLPYTLGPEALVILQRRWVERRRETPPDHLKLVYIFLSGKPGPCKLLLHLIHVFIFILFLLHLPSSPAITAFQEPREAGEDPLVFPSTLFLEPSLALADLETCKELLLSLSVSAAFAGSGSLEGSSESDEAPSMSFICLMSSFIFSLTCLVILAFLGS